MSKFKVTPLTIALTTILTGCGGGGSDGDQTLTEQPKQEKAAVSVLDDPSNTSIAELSRVTTALISDRYKGVTTPANLDNELLRKGLAHLFDDSTDGFSGMDMPYLQDHVSNDGSISGLSACPISGNVTYRGKVNENGNGAVLAKFSDCVMSDENEKVDGSMTIAVYMTSATTGEVAMLFNNFTSSNNEQKIKLTGSFITSSGYDTTIRENTTNIKQHLLVEVNGSYQIISELTVNDDGYNNNMDYHENLQIEGTLTFSNEGVFAFSGKDLYGYSPSFEGGELRFEGSDKIITLEFENTGTTYFEDSNKDGQYDLTTNISDIKHFISGELSDLTLVPLNPLSLPPIVYSPNRNDDDEYFATSPIIVENGHYEDPDTPLHQLEVSFRWYLNGQLIEGQTTNTLPAGIAVFGDTLEVAMVVSDSDNTVVSPTLNLDLQDSPIQLTIEGLDDSITSGQTVSFTPIISDPDKPNDTLVTQLISAPEGTILSDNGVLTWTVPTNMLFTSQEFYFSFTTPGEDSEQNAIVTEKVRVTTNKALPIAHSGIEAPTEQRNFLIDDFDGDNKNEILTTDNNWRIMLVEQQNEETKQKWLYPYELPSGGKVVQIAAANTDEDSESEIFIVTEFGVSLINNLDNEAVTVFNSETKISAGAVQDIDGDGIVEIALLHGESQYSAYRESLSVFSLKDTTNMLFETAASNTRTVHFANLDDDSQLELVLSSGLIYDTKDWQSQSAIDTTFSKGLITTGDFNGDGVQELAGVSDELELHSLAAKSLLANHPLSDNGTCSITAANLDNDTDDELLVGDCQWGNIRAYDVTADNSISEIWSIDMVDYGSTSLTVGDSDNDGKMELLWGTGGINRFNSKLLVTADIDATTPTVRKDMIAPQLDSYVPAGWSSLKQESDNAIFFVPGTNSGSGGSRVLTTVTNGSYRLSAPTSSNWNYHSSAHVADFYQNGVAQLLIPITEAHSANLAVMDIRTEAVSYQLNTDSDATIKRVTAADANGDNIPDAIYSTSQSVKFVDVYNEALIGNYSTSEDSMSDFSVHYGETLTLAVAEDRLKLLQSSINGFEQLSAVEQSCSHIEFFNYDQDPEQELLCLKVSEQDNEEYATAIYIYEIVNNVLQLVHQRDLTKQVKEIVVSPTRTSSQELILVTQIGKDWDSEVSSQLIYTDSRGYPLWASPMFPGTVSGNAIKARQDSNGKLNLLLSTSEAMYQIH
ncbi:FG-GAP repeat domain-containing protein [Pseudoalteromonas rubra]|uniref:FG-GAP repeat domain-containing protein n=1 Tax=Pseudoalteromonas rubra TaxID=43658 RepID=UPI000F786830|nr:VCBS repeat-containing protein [Pseudoalteromonas rubra]